MAADDDAGETPGINKEAEKAAALQQRLAVVERQLSRLERSATDGLPMGLTLRRCRIAGEAGEGSKAPPSYLLVEAVAAGSAVEREGASPGDILVAVEGGLADKGGARGATTTLAEKLSAAARAESVSGDVGSDSQGKDDDEEPAPLLTLTFRRGAFEKVSSGDDDKEEEAKAASSVNGVSAIPPSDGSSASDGQPQALLLSREDMSIFSDSWATGKATLAFNHPQNTYFPMGIEPAPAPKPKPTKPLGVSWTNRRSKGKVWYDSK